MIDREKVIRAVETCFDSWIDKHRDMGLDLHEVERMKRDALELLKEQKPREPHYTKLEYTVNGMPVVIKHPECPRCYDNGLVLWDAEIEKGVAYCKRCGQAVKWDDA